ncbi:hypothetical protein SAY86_027169 [Trapa natans]|uniref:Diacylglycerol O-acyltransferase n=1 Tax=Trapa natans TaxID=22666 RepID=A0AAN7KQ86_TRANT|nr:hypothetical protein SAY86_027169 [Trapa natans]
MGLHENVADDEPLSPGGRLFLQKETAQVVLCAMGMKNPIDVEAVMASIEVSVMLKHPRFRSLLVRDSRGVEHWRRTEVVMARHFFILNDPIVGSYEDDEGAVREYLADLSMSPEMSPEKPLWEIHILRAHGCLIWRIHHALGDGISLMSMLMAGCRKVDDPEALPTIPRGKREWGKGASLSWRESVMRLLRVIWFTIVSVVGLVLRIMWMKDRKSLISGGLGVELWPRKLATAKFGLDDMKLARRSVAGATLNDVLLGVISMGLSRYINEKEPNSTSAGLRVTGMGVVNLRKQPGLHELTKMTDEATPARRWGNRFGIFLLPLHCHESGTNAVVHLREAKRVMDRCKNSFQAHFSYWFMDLVMACFGPRLSSALNNRIVCHTTFTLSNMVGPQEPMTYVGNPVTYIRPTSCAMANALTMHMVSYANRADLQILVPKDIIPDPHYLARCFEEALLEMKEAAAATMKD